MVVWSMVNAVDTDAPTLDRLKAKAALMDEAIYGADYLMRSLSPGDYFYMTVFSYFKKDPSAWRVVGLLADSKTTSDYQCAFREGGGMAIAALARISRWEQGGAFSAQTISGRRGAGVRAFAGQQPEIRRRRQGKHHCRLLRADGGVGIVDGHGQDGLSR